MATIKRFEDLKCWQESRVLAQLVFEAFLKDNRVKDYALINQINAASGSVMDNIAEGFERDGKKEFNQFLSIAKASCGEVRSQLYRALDRNYLSQDQFNELFKRTEGTSQLIGGMMRYLKDSEYSGTKFMVKEPEPEFYTSNNESNPT